MRRDLPNMQLSVQDQNRFREWIQNKPGLMRCTCCGLGNWEIGLGGIVLGIDLRSTRFFYHQGLPVVSLICKNCGQVLFFSAAVMGFKPDEPETIPVSEPRPQPAPEDGSPSER